MMTTIQERFKQWTGAQPDIVVVAPGRVNLIGEHTDYNGGFVLPVAVDRYCTIAARKRNDNLLKAYALDFDSQAQVDTGNLVRKEGDERWINYISGCFWILQQEGRTLGGHDIMVTSEVPVGSGMSSSAAIEVAGMTLLNELYGLGLKPEQIAVLARKVENAWVGVPCGIMDQFVSATGKDGYAVLLDCATLEYRHVPLNWKSISIVVGDTKVRRQLASSAYRKRVEECAAGLKLINELSGNQFPNLGQVDIATFKKVESRLPEPLQRRCRHVVTEDARVHESVTALSAGNLEEFGRLLNASHESLKTDYEVSCDELNELVDAARSVQGVLGARLTGAGFGGCMIAIARDAAVEAASAAMQSAYERRFKVTPAIFTCRSAQGAHVAQK